jgi:hypothetical protein
MKTIELELIAIKFISGNVDNFWIPNGLANALCNDIKFISAYGVMYASDINEDSVDTSFKYSIRMDSIEYIRYKDKFKTIEVDK